MGAFRLDLTRHPAWKIGYLRPRSPHENLKMVFRICSKATPAAQIQVVHEYGELPSDPRGGMVGSGGPVVLGPSAGISLLSVAASAWSIGNPLPSQRHQHFRSLSVVVCGVTWP